MATAKSRSGKRSSSTPYTPTIMTVVFISLSVLVIWMFTSKSVKPPQANTRLTSSTTEEHHTNSPPFDDAQNDLPEEATKQDQTSDPVENVSPEDRSQNESQESEEEISKIQESNPHSDAIAEKPNSGEEEDTGNPKIKESNPNSDAIAVKPNSGEEEEKEIPKIQESSPNSGAIAEKTNSGEQEKGSPRIQKSNTKWNSIAEKPNSKDEKESPKVQESNTNANSIAEKFNPGQEEEKESPTIQKSNPNSNSVAEKPNSREEEKEDKIETAKAPKSDDPNEKPDESNTSDSFRAGNSVFPKTKTLDLNATIGNASLPVNSGEEGKEDSTLTEEKTDTFPSGIPKESKDSKKSWSTQAEQSENEKERRQDEGEAGEDGIDGHTWLLCNSSAGPDYIPCLDNEKAISKLRTRKHYEHRERHCPEHPPECLVVVPDGYKKPIEWPNSRDKIWYHNVPHTQLAEVKGHQNWVKMTGEFLTFPGGGTQFIHGALHYIDFIEKSVPKIQWGKQTRVILDVGCGVASFGGFLFERDVLTMSFAPKDEHEAQVQFALERGIPAISAVMGSQRLPFPGRVFDLVHCARCRVPWHIDGGALLLELNRVLRPGGFFVWSATPVYQNLEEDVEIWKEMTALTASMCWELVSINKDKINSIGAAIYRKPINNQCYSKRKSNRPPMCKNNDDPNAAWYVPLQACMHAVPEEVVKGSLWPEQWPNRLTSAPYWLNSSQIGIYGKPAPEDFAADYAHWNRVVRGSYMKALGITWKNVRNIMDMRSVYGGFAAALKDHDVWVMNVVNIDSPDTLPIIYERGLFGIYHDWCESFSTYPRSYDLLHADHLFSKLRKRCKLVPVMAEVDRMVRPGGKLIVRDESNSIREVENLLKSLHWEVHLTFSKNKEGILSAQKSEWRPKAYATSS